MSPRAAWRLEQLGFKEVYDYVAGKADWIASGLPTVRSPDSDLRAGDVMETGPPTVLLGQSAGDVAASGGRSLIVVNEERIVFGRLMADEAEAHPDATAEELMSPGPTTVRAHEPLEPLHERMRAAHVHEVVVSTPEGRLLGVVHLPNI
ncbi:MAG: CBS domain-containing protein [Actinobacteria bacterium]|nr:CBS domain-containing protein [Actinomycetota bacterium]